MRKSTFYGLATLCAVGSLLFGFEFFVGGRSSSQPPEARVEQDFLAIGNALKSYQINAGRPPTTGQGLDVLVNEPKQGPKPKRWVQVMKKMPPDPWQIPYCYTLLSPKEYEWRWELRSAGPDRVFGSGDDLVDEYQTGKLLPMPAGEPEADAGSRPSY